MARIYESGPSLKEIWHIIPWVLKKNVTGERSMVAAEVINNLIEINIMSNGQGPGNRGAGGGPPPRIEVL